MRRLIEGSLIVLTGCLLVGCEEGRGPRLALGTGKAGHDEVATAAPAPPPAHPPASKQTAQTTRHRYQGRTAEDWGKVLEEKEPGAVLRATRALYVLGSAGRPYLVKGLDSDNPEVRRMCLDSLSLSDLKLYGSDGRQTLLKLAGDSQDLRIRQRASVFLQQWNDAVPSRP